MSASLVGSEMCIRDSRPPDSLKKCLRRHAPEALFLWYHFALSRARHNLVMFITPRSHAPKI
eukprot:1800883-Alexandrium_andersonii.AAC.1